MQRKFGCRRLAYVWRAYSEILNKRDNSKSLKVCKVGIGLGFVILFFGIINSYFMEEDWLLGKVQGGEIFFYPVIGGVTLCFFGLGYSIINTNYFSTDHLTQRAAEINSKIAENYQEVNQIEDYLAKNQHLLRAETGKSFLELRHELVSKDSLLARLSGGFFKN